MISVVGVAMVGTRRQPPTNARKAAHNTQPESAKRPAVTRITAHRTGDPPVDGIGLVSGHEGNCAIQRRALRVSCNVTNQYPTDIPQGHTAGRWVFSIAAVERAESETLAS